MYCYVVILDDADYDPIVCDSTIWFIFCWLQRILWLVNPTSNYVPKKGLKVHTKKSEFYVKKRVW